MRQLTFFALVAVTLLVWTIPLAVHGSIAVLWFGLGALFMVVWTTTIERAIGRL